MILGIRAFQLRRPVHPVGFDEFFGVGSRFIARYPGTARAPLDVQRRLDFLPINIIGFALDDEMLEAQFAEWAELGGGEYYSAGNADSFSHALQAALRIPYLVFGRDGAEMARGLVDGEPVELPAGTYRVVVTAASTQQFEGIRIPADTDVEVRLE